jgi:hypothetical protein
VSRDETGGKNPVKKPTTVTPPQILVISGSMGAGKTTVLGEASDLLSVRGVSHAAIDLDWLGAGHVSNASLEDLMFRNLATVWRNFEAAGVTRLLIARAVETQAEHARIRIAVPGGTVTVARLVASLATMQRRVRIREPGLLQQSFVDRVAELDALLDQAHVEDFTIVNDARPVTDVARELLDRAAWLKEG